jgi:hypothetical protein
MAIPGAVALITASGSQLEFAQIRPIRGIEHDSAIGFCNIDDGVLQGEGWAELSDNLADAITA